MLERVIELVTVDLRLAKNVLKEFEIALILDINIYDLLAASALLQAVVLFLKLSNDSALPPATFDTDEEEIWCLTTFSLTLSHYFFFLHDLKL